MPTTIEVDAPLVTLINVFSVDPTRQDELLAALSQATRSLFARVPGFISANFHTSLDGTKVVNYAQWASDRHFREMLEMPDIQAHMAEIMKIADRVEPTLFNVRATHQSQS